MVLKVIRAQLSRTFQEFIRHQQSAGFLIIGCTALSLILANTPAYHTIEKIWETNAGIQFGNFSLFMTTHGWINDGLMAIFFFMVGLEIKRELIGGELSSFKKASLPVAAALGGMIVPAFIYYSLNYNFPETLRGWGIPMATDIAFALAVLLLAGNKIPFALKLMLTSLAVVDDLGAIIVIALFYSEKLQLNYLLATGGLTLLLSLMNYSGVKRFVWYVVPGLLLWYTIYKSGIHATVAGVIHAMTIPYDKHNEVESTLVKVEHEINVPVNFFILPLFALSNTLIHLDFELISNLISPLSLGIMLGLIIGKPLGITSFVWLAVKSGISSLDENMNFKQIFSVSLIGGIGFTMSIFITVLAFKDVTLVNTAKLAILLSSLIAALSGIFFITKLNR
ncbi:MAG: Na+/H+ antiporter NhaA [Chitinophagales bacterium]|nr:Na+/H+ antiporter NhaA [Chitinophagales bacterium]MDW8274371.1 Na+/H+ antiporter NhaA [Chitinophagales bacterium]